MGRVLSKNAIRTGSNACLMAVPLKRVEASATLVMMGTPSTRKVAEDPETRNLRP